MAWTRACSVDEVAPGEALVKCSTRGAPSAVENISAVRIER